MGHAVRSVRVAASYAYLAGESDTEFRSMDISTTTPAFIGGYNATGTTQYGKSIGIVPGASVIYFGRLDAGNHELYTLDASNPASPMRLGSIDVTGDVNAILVRDYLAFLATNDSNNEFKIYNISDSSNITFWSSFNFPQDATDIDYENNLVFVSVRANNALRIITSSP
ncbi:MAG: hypothetical protein HY460_03050 [Parcubacteria group bacterium]|nr:hypothetical protein [Parcubacteria group bacterium]